MKILDLNAFGVEEMREDETKNIDGGFWRVMATVYLIDNRERVWEGIKKGINDIF